MKISKYSIPVFIIWLLVLPLTAFNQSIMVGAAKRILTPNPLLPISGGIGTPNPVKENKGDLFVRAMVIEKGETIFAIVSVDFLGWTSILGNRSRALIKGIPPENILIGATHTHSAPDPYGFPDMNGKTFADIKYLDGCVQQIADAVNEAIANKQPASLKIAMDEAVGKIAYNYYAPALYDPRCGVIQALATSGPRMGQPIVTLVNYAIHPEVLGNKQGILSPDLCGPLYSKIEKETGGMALFMNGAIGGMVTADTRLEYGKEGQGQKEDNSWEECIRIGELLASESLRIIQKAPVLDNPAVFIASRPLTFPVESDIMRFIIQKSSMKYESFADNKVTTQLNLINIGPAQILTVPGEAMPNVGYYVKRNMNTTMPFLFGLTNDAFGYMLAKVDFQSFKRYDYVTRTSLGEMTAEIYMEQALKLVKESPAATAK
ncbi:MAG: hypothetical protein NWT07_08300 [Saprospiraceae bacterium]|nr:hypothetical protein [Saprospiraceae bacterium]MDP4851683.1 hypothetical protein [Saprospiraceae bacterium]